jgi:TPR repeat protein
MSDDREAARLYKLAADEGNASAQYNLGIFYSFSRGALSQDYHEAARLFKLAADQGHASAQYNLGVFYDRGRGGLRRDDREATRLYKLAADQGDASAQWQSRGLLRAGRRRPAAGRSRGRASLQARRR